MALSLLGLGGLAEARGEDVRLSVEVLDAKGQVARDLAAGDLEIREGDTIVPVAGVTSAAPSRVVLFFDRALSTSGTLKRAASGLAGLSRQLAALGEVEIVTASDDLETLASRDSLVIQETLMRSALTDTGERRLLEIRQRVLRELRLTAPPSTVPGPAEVAEIVAAGVEEELELIRERQHRLIAWASESRGTGAAHRPGDPALLVWVTDGYDLDPVGFYLQVLDGDDTRAAISRVSRLETLDDASRRLARTLAALGWIVVPVAIAADDDETPGLEYAPIEVDAERGGATAAPGITVRPGSLFGRKREDDEKPAPAARLLEPRAPLALLAEASGGEVVTTDQALRDAVGRFARRFQVTYRSSLPLEVGSERLEVRAAKPGLTVRARRWVSRGIPEAVAAVRLERLLAGFEDDGGFDVAAVLRVEAPPAGSAESKAELEARLELRELAAAAPDGPRRELDQAVFRVTLAVAAGGEEPRLRHEVVRAERLLDLEEWRYDASLDLPPDATAVAVLVEDLAGGRWGGRRATVVEGDFAAGSELLPAPAVVEIVPPDEELLRGRVKFETQVYDSRVARVDFLLDDREVESASRPPYAARIDLGRTPRRRTLTVIAYDAENAEIGGDSAVLNGGGGGLGVEIVRPSDFRGSGWVEVEAEVTVPLERRLDRVVFYWNDEQVATVYAPPFRQRVLIPEDKPVGYVRVLALLDDGTLAEDVAFMNGPAHGERLEVNLVELYVVVTDQDGRPVRGLDQTDFRVREDGVPQEIATFSDASDLPLTLGMAIDSSASMFVKLPTVQSAAIDFLHSTFTEQDRAFVVDFDSEPRLARGTTGSLDHIVRSIGSLEANGRTALWESIVFSLVQLQGVRGRKALIVFSDGSDEDDQFPFRSSLSVAKKMGVPIYLILMRKEPKPESGLSLLVRSFASRVDRLVEATGGRVFYAREYDNLGGVYEDIEHELRSQYLLAYYSRERSRDAWRSVDVDVDKRGLTPRTLSGYWQ